MRVLTAVGVLVGVLAATALTAATGEEPVPFGEVHEPPTDAGESIFAMADDTGAVVARTVMRGTQRTGLQLTGVRRGGAVAWTTTVPAEFALFACAGCPDVFFAGHRDGGLYVFADGHPRRVAPVGEPVDQVGPIRGVGPVPDAPVHATRPGDAALRLRLLRPAHVAASLTEPGVLLPLTGWQEYYGIVALSSDGRRALAVTAVDPVHVGERRILQVQGDTVVRDDTTPVVVSDLLQLTHTAGCLSGDGARIAALAPSGRGTRVLTGGWGLLPAGSQAPVMAAAGIWAGCSFTRTGLAVYGISIENPAAVAVVRGYGGARETTSLIAADPPDQVEVCGDGIAGVLSAGTVIVETTHGRRTRYPASQIGCTPGGDLWLLQERGLTWLSENP